MGVSAGGGAAKDVGGAGYFSGGSDPAECGRVCGAARATLVDRAKALGGRFDSGLTDVGEKHDAYFAESILGE